MLWMSKGGRKRKDPPPRSLLVNSSRPLGPRAEGRPCCPWEPPATRSHLKHIGARQTFLIFATLARCSQKFLGVGVETKMEGGTDVLRIPSVGWWAGTLKHRVRILTMGKLPGEVEPLFKYLTYLGSLTRGCCKLAPTGRHKTHTHTHTKGMFWGGWERTPCSLETSPLSN